MTGLAAAAHFLMILLSSPFAEPVGATIAPAVPGAESAEPAPEAHPPWIWLPVIMGAPETGFGGGLVAGWFEGGGVGETPSSAVGNVILTSKGHRMAGLVAEAYFGDGRIRVTADLKAQKYPDVFYGTGPATTTSMEEDFTSRAESAELTAQLELRPGWWVGGMLRARHDRLVETSAEGRLATGDVPGSEGGIASGVGIVGILDTRSNLYDPRRGSYGELRLMTFEPALGSDYDFQRLSVDIRHFLPVGASTTLATRAFAASTSGGAPFQELASIGAEGMMRGYREGRYRDRAAAAAEVELRFPVAGRFGATVFAGIGGVGPELGGLPALDELERAVGVGLRFRLNDGGVNFRVDYGVGREEGALYLGIGEAF